MRSPLDLAALALSVSQITLSWTDNSLYETGFRIERASSSTGPWTEIGETSANVSYYYDDTGLDPGTTYYYRVYGFNTRINSDESNIASATTVDEATPPASPTGLALSAAYSTQVNLVWTDNSDNESGFKIERASYLSGQWTQVMVTAANVTSTTDSGLTPKKNYFYRVRATNSAGDSAPSSYIVARTTTNSPAQVPVPHGIYMLDDRSGTYRLGSLWQANKPHIDGYVWRISWDELDTGITAPTYHLDALDSAVSALQALSNNQDNRMKLSLGMYALEVPTYVLNSAAETYTALLFGNTGTAETAVPWDVSSQTYFRNFVQAMANHPVYDAVSKTYIPFRDHPALGQVVAPIIGMQWYRDQGPVTSSPNYTRTKFIQAIIANIHIIRDAFPNKPVYLGFFGMNDDTKSPSLDSALLSAIMSEFDGTKKPRIGFFEELLRGDAPGLSGSNGKNLLDAHNGGNPILFQACSPWLTKNLCDFTPGDNSPENGLDHGYNDFGATYFEMYAADLANPAWTTMFTQWQSFLQNTP